MVSALVQFGFRHIKVFHGINWALRLREHSSNETPRLLVRFSDFFVRRPEEFEGTLNNCSKYKKFEESYAQLIGILNELRWHGGIWKTTVPCKFPTVLGQVLTVVFQLRRSCYHYNRLSRRSSNQSIPLSNSSAIPWKYSDIVARSRCKVTGLSSRMILRFS